MVWMIIPQSVRHHKYKILQAPFGIQALQEEAHPLESTPTEDLMDWQLVQPEPQAKPPMSIAVMGWLHLTYEPSQDEDMQNSEVKPRDRDFDGTTQSGLDFVRLSLVAKDLPGYTFISLIHWELQGKFGSTEFFFVSGASLPRNNPMEQRMSAYAHTLVYG